MIELSYTCVREALYNAGLDEEAIRADYSGRGMYGRTCFGIVHHDAGELLKFAVELDRITDDLDDWIGGARQDGMGLATITYWPDVVLIDAPEEVA